MMMELEKENDGQMMLRIYNTGAGVEKYHTTTAIKPTADKFLSLPFYEIVDVNASRLLGGAFTCFVSFVANNPPPLGDGWTPSVLYEVLLGSVGGHLSARQIPQTMLNFPQVIGNCAMGSVLKVMDKLMLTESLAEKMKLITFVRFTKAYRRKLARNPMHNHSDTVGEARRRLLLKGVQATLEQIERALETVGVVGEEIEATLLSLRTIRADTEAELDQDPDGLLSLNAPSSAVWSSQVCIIHRSKMQTGLSFALLITL
jgi:hypothetical protein